MLMKSSDFWRCLTIFFAVTALAPFDGVVAEDAPVFIRAKNLQANRNKNGKLTRVTAKEDALVSYKGFLIESPYISYTPEGLKITAQNPTLYKKNGERLFARQVTSENGLDQYSIEAPFALLSDNSKLAAQTGEKKGPRSIYNFVVYSPCHIDKSLEKSPTWQFKAKSIEMDETESLVKLRGAIFEMWGVPIAYLPYFSYPDPRVKRKSGFLTPRLFPKTAAKTGFLMVPYFYEFDASSDITISPFISIKEMPILSLKYRKLFYRGHMNFSTSATRQLMLTNESLGTFKRRFQGHIIGSAKYDMTPNWQVNFNVERETNPTYLKRFRIVESSYYTGLNFLQSSLKFEGFYGRSYSYLEGYSFQSLLPQSLSHETPFVGPFAGYDYISHPFRNGSQLKVSGSELFIARKNANATAMNRISQKVEWSLPVSTPIGAQFKVSTSLRGDLYSIWTPSSSGSQKNINISRGRAHPKLSALLSFPLANIGESYQQTLEPVIEFVASPRIKQKGKFPNVDSQDFEYDVTNIFRPDRYAGLDLVDDSSRFAYGVQGFIFFESNSSLEYFLGQTYSLSPPPYSQKKSGLKKGFSDFLWRLGYSPGENFNFLWDARFDYKSFKPAQTFFQVGMGPKEFQISLNYIDSPAVFFDEQETNRKELSLSINSAPVDSISLFASTSRALGKSGGTLEYLIGTEYRDECFSVKIQYGRSFFRDRDLSPSTNLMLVVGFKNLGSVPVPVKNILINNSKAITSRKRGFSDVQ